MLEYFPTAYCFKMKMNSRQRFAAALLNLHLITLNVPSPRYDRMWKSQQWMKLFGGNNNVLCKYRMAIQREFPINLFERVWGARSFPRLDRSTDWIWSSMLKASRLFAKYRPAQRAVFPTRSANNLNDLDLFFLSVRRFITVYAWSSKKENREEPIKWNCTIFEE